MCEPYPIIVACEKKKKNQMITKKSNIIGLLIYEV